MAVYLPEGRNKKDAEKITEKTLYTAAQTGCILEGKAFKCDSGHNLLVKLGDYVGFIPREETALGIKEKTVREIAIISRVNKTVAFKVTEITQKDGSLFPILSRAALQEECLEYLLKTLKKGDIIEATVTHLEPFGAFVDIGCGVTSLITIDNISVSRISHPKDRFYQGQNIYAVVKEIDCENRRFTLSHKELLGTWKENVDLFECGQTVQGIVRSIEPYGAFIELTPNLAGLAEANENMQEGQSVAVYIKSIIPEKMKVKLNLIDIGNLENSPAPLTYFITEGNLPFWQYSPKESRKQIQTVF